MHIDRIAAPRKLAWFFDMLDLRKVPFQQLVNEPL